jgi:hypothetical protein
MAAEEVMKETCALKECFNKENDREKFQHFFSLILSCHHVEHFQPDFIN